MQRTAPRAAADADTGRREKGLAYPMNPSVFSSAEDSNAQIAFQRWQEGNPDGFYVNRKAGTYGMLHRVGCCHVGGAGDWNAEFGDVTKRVKVCHLDRAALTNWAERHGVTLAMCNSCNP